MFQLSSLSMQRSVIFALREYASAVFIEGLLNFLRQIAEGRRNLEGNCDTPTRAKRKVDENRNSAERWRQANVSFCVAARLFSTFSVSLFPLVKQKSHKENNSWNLHELLFWTDMTLPLT